MRILFIAPIPPPINGQSKASLVLLEKLEIENCQIITINLSKTRLKSGFSSFSRVMDIVLLLIDIWKNRKKSDIIYLSLAESFLGNLRDIVIYIICYKSRRKIFVHMLGGAQMKKILETKGIIQKINCYFISKAAGILVEGPENFEVFSKVASDNKIHIIPNFAEDYLFVDDNEIKAKFSNPQKIQILFLSNLISGKGYDELADAYIEMSEELKDLVNIVFVGGFETRHAKNKFIQKIHPYDGLKYLGNFIDGEKKRELYCQSQAFCLPTYYPFEGQPISILEAYATGCVVITSNHSGIPFIFTNLKNGFVVEKKSKESIKKTIEILLSRRNELEEIALYNRNLASKKYRTSIYQNSIFKVFRDFIA